MPPLLPHRSRSIRIKHGWPAAPTSRQIRPRPAEPPTVEDDDPSLPPDPVVLDQKSVAFDPFRSEPGFERLAGIGDSPGSWRTRPLRSRGGDRKRSPRYCGSWASNATYRLVDAAIRVGRRTHANQEPPRPAQTGSRRGEVNDLERRAVSTLEPHQWYELKASDSGSTCPAGSGKKPAASCWTPSGICRPPRGPGSTRPSDTNSLAIARPSHELATFLRSEFQYSEKAIVIWVRTAPESVTLESLLAATTSFMSGSEELNLALAHRAFVAGRSDKAIPFATRATELCPDSPQAWFVLGESRHAAAFPGPVGRGADAVAPRAVVAYTRTVARADRSADRIGSGRTLQSRKGPGPSSTIPEPKRTCSGRSNWPVPTSNCELDTPAISTEEPCGPRLQELGGLAGVASGERLFFEAAARYERNSGNDREVASPLTQTAHRRRRIKALGRRPHSCRRMGRGRPNGIGGTATTRDKCKKKAPATYHTLHGWLLASAGETEAARASLSPRHRRPYRPVRGRDELFLLAQAFVRVDEGRPRSTVA